mgnify:CR=1 FL=1
MLFEVTKHSLSLRVEEAALKRAIGEVITYAELTALMGIPAQASRGRGAILRARHRLLRDHDRYLANVPLEGYVIVPAAEHVGAARSQEDRSLAAQEKAKKILEHTRLDELDGPQQTMHLAAQIRAELKLALCVRLDRERALPAGALVVLPGAVQQLVSYLRTNTEG